MVLDRPGEEDDALAQESRICRSPLAATGILYDLRDQVLAVDFERVRIVFLVSRTANPPAGGAKIIVAGPRAMGAKSRRCGNREARP